MITSGNYYNLAVLGYIMALLSYSLNIVFQKNNIRNISIIIIAISFIAQTIGIAFRWFEAGLIEISAYEAAKGINLTGIERFVVSMYHPPWSNLYEIMIYMSWGLILVFLIIEIKWDIKFLSISILMLVLTTMGLASLSDDSIKPLVPALRSWWLTLHVVSASIAYSAGTVGAILSLIYLIKSKSLISISKIAGGIMFTSAVIEFILGRGFLLFTTFSYRVKILSKSNVTNNIEPLLDNGLSPIFIDSPYVGYLLITCISMSMYSAISLFSRKSYNGIINKLDKYFYIITFIITLFTVLLIIYNNISMINIFLSDKSIINLTSIGPYTLGLKSNHWDLSLFIIILFFQLLIGFALLYPKILRDLLPEESKIDKLAYMNIVIAFILVTIVLITGSLWAYYAWGRYWAWDPKETGALIIWIIYAFYLHTKITDRWSKVYSAIIGIIAFFVILAGFLGVNLGFFSNGLHSYGKY